MEYLLRIRIRILIFCITSLILLAFSFPSFSADNNLIKNQPNLHNSGAKVLRTNKLTIDDGLSTSEIRAVVQDHIGYIWIGTPVGLNRYDGSDIKKYFHDPESTSSLSNNLVNDLLVDHLGQLWIATNKGLNRYNQEADSFIVYLGDKDDDTSINNNNITNLFEDSKHRLWIGTLTGLNRYDSETGTFVRYQHDTNDPLNSIRAGHVRAIFEDPQGMIWIGTTSGSSQNARGITRLNIEAGTFTHFDHDPNDETSLQSGSVKTIFSTVDNRIWVGTFGGGISEYLPASNSFRRLKITREMASDSSENVVTQPRINGSLVDRRGDVWLVTRYDGLLRFDPDKDSFLQYTYNPGSPYGLVSNQLVSIFEDRDGLIWLGSASKGLNILDYRTMNFNHVNPGIDIKVFNDVNIRAVEELDDGRIAIGTSTDGVALYDPSNYKMEHLYSEFIDGYHARHAFAIENLAPGVVLVASNQGVYKLDLNSGEKKYFPLVSEHTDKMLFIVVILKSKDGKYWLLSSGNGLFNLDIKTGKFTAYPFTKNNGPLNESSLSSHYPRDIIEDQDGNLWIASIRGLNRFNRQSQTFKHYVHDPDNTESIPTNLIYKIQEEGNDKIWLATNKGLVLFDKKNETFRTFTKKHGLPDNHIYCMETAGKYLWLGTNNGLSRWDRLNFRALNYYQESGLQSNEFNTYGCSISKSGNLYFAGINGFNYFKPSEVEINSQPPDILISEVKLDENIVAVKEDSSIEIPFDNNLLQLEFRGLDYSAPKLLNYQIKLENFDKEWRNLGNKNNTIYTNLGAGQYTFKVRVVNQYGISSKEVELDFNQQRHPLLSIFAISFYVLIFIAGIYIFLTYQKRQLAIHKDIANRERKLSGELRQLSVHLQNAREEERASLARELHDELAQILVAIKLEVSWIQSTLQRKGAKKVISRMPEVHEIVDTCVSSVRNIATGLRPSILDDMGLIPALDWYSNSVCERAKLKLQFTTNCESIYLSRALSINIYRILQEAVTNVIRHARAKQIDISCILTEQRFQLTVKDDGVGIADGEMEKTGHYGLIGMRERVEGYNGTVMINSNNPTGVSIDINIPVTDDIMEESLNN